MDYIDHEGLFETTPELFAQWLYQETFRQWPQNSIVSEFASYPPESNEVEHGISLAVELLPSDDNEPVVVRNTIRFWMLQTSASPNKTRIRGKCRTGILQIDRGATIDYKNAVACYEELWEKICSQFTRAGLTQEEKLSRNSEFDTSVLSVAQELNQVKSEDIFINNILKPLFEVMGYEGVTRLHHTGRPEDGKDNCIL